jgi:hypothetical protein
LKAGDSLGNGEIMVSEPRKRFSIAQQRVEREPRSLETEEPYRWRLSGDDMDLNSRPGLQGKYLQIEQKRIDANRKDSI